ncbi:MAG: phosphotransferase [Bacteroidetes bacterium]|nr:phosphotransferase [Bacteroidota bacterium]
MEVNELPAAGSYRQYYRINGQNKNAIGVFSPDKQENKAFLGFTKHFSSCGLAVPDIYAVDESSDCYLLSDLGDLSLLQKLEEGRKNGRPDAVTIDLYKAVIKELPRFQVEASAGLNYNLCYPVKEFDARSMRWDLNYFKYYFLRLLKIPFNEHALENDFDRLILYLLKAGTSFFMYRDFQARNILIHQGKPWFIDYQGGRRGPLQYDLASLLFQVKADLPFDLREEMLNEYLDCLSKYHKVDRAAFISSYYGFVLIRLLQVMGAYGFRGYFERRAHFLQSIPYAIENVKWWLDNIQLEPQLPELMKALRVIAVTDVRTPFASIEQGLTVSVNSFAYKNGAPIDYSGNGGGFVFDCRALPNPGRYEHFKSFTGKDSLVRQFLDREPLVDKFLANVYKLVDQSVLEYQRRGFSSLQVNFGCTGGQHRSVFCAEKLAKYLEEKYSLEVKLYHTELDKQWL